MVTLHEAAVESIFGQTGFTDPIDLRIGPTIEYVAPDLLTVDSEAEWNLLRNNFFGLPNTTVRTFFVDAITWCGDNGNVAGCANGAIAIYNSNSAASSVFGDELVAHELGHVFGLDHTGGDNLMNPTVVDGRSSLTGGQITTILDDHNVQFDINNMPYVDISPVLIVAAATSVPVPGALILMLGALAPLGAFRRTG